jgi:acyl carrier protein phosphodiesterase
MNFLGHCLFSEPTPDAVIGSIWPDFARRPPLEDCSGVFLTHFNRHQTIDKITDTHDLLEPLRAHLRPTFRKTTPVIIDMMLDHHLALHWSNYDSCRLEEFSVTTYQLMNDFSERDLPERMGKTIYWMEKHNWFVSYRTEAGIMRALEGMSQRIRFDNPIYDNRHLIPKITQDFHDELDAFVQYLTFELKAGRL